MRRGSLLLCLLLLILPGLVIAQGVTTGDISGIVVDNESKGLPGVSVVAIHVPTGTHFETVTRNDGRFFIPSVRVGGPYKITASLEGFKSEELANVSVKLGETKQLRFQLTMATMDVGEIVVTASNPVINSARTGAAQNVSETAIEAMPSLTRNFADYTRLSPQMNVADNFSDQAISFGGRNNRYNSVQIDGAVNNDLFGLADSGTPGGQASTTPISLDAIQEFQIVVSPYDVRHGGFTGGGINAITRSGTNRFTGSVFFFGRNQSFVGDGPSGVKMSDFDEAQYGLRFGGPIVKDKLFFFVSGELSRRNEPTQYYIDGSGSALDYGYKAEADRFLSILKNKYGHDAGSYNIFNKNQDSNKLFVRMDYNIDSRNRLTLRHNWVDASKDNFYNSSALNFSFSDSNYTFNSNTHSTVAQLNSALGRNTYNELVLNYTTIRESRDFSNAFPSIDVLYAPGRRFYAGVDRYSQANGLDQDIIELTDNLTIFKGKHTFTLGTHNEFFKFDNLFIKDVFGYYRFNSLDLFEAGKAWYYEHSFSNTEEAMKTAKFSVSQLGFYAGDNWSILPNLKLTLGLRADVPIFNDDPTYNADVETIYGLRNDKTPSGKVLISPRLGFNWDVTGDRSNQIRGGVGVFTGRTPYVWISNSFANTGIEFTRLTKTDNKNGINFISDPNGQPTSLGAASTNEINLSDSNFKFPQVFRTNIALDKQLFWGIIGTVEFIYSKNLNECLFQNINLVQSGVDAFDGRPLYKTRISNKYSNVILLKNTSKGYQYSLSFQLQKNFSEGTWVNASYTYGQAKDQNSATSSQALSSWQYNHIDGDPNNPKVTWSAFDIRHRISLGISYQLPFSKKYPTQVALFYNARSGRPYSTRYDTDYNGDGSYYNDLIYVPKSADEIILTKGTWEELNAYIEADPALRKARGSIIGRNASREPWYHRMDLRFLQDVSLPGLKGNKLQLTLDIMNVLNMLSSDWGKLQYVYYRGGIPLKYNGIDAKTGKPKFDYVYAGQNKTNPYETNDLNSRWQIQFGARYTF